jgi:CBS domain-containing protein
MTPEQPTFKEILESVQKTRKPTTTYPHIALQAIGASRRGWKVVEAINRMLEDYEVICEPEFGSAWIYGPIEIRPKPKVAAGKPGSSIIDKDPTPRLSLLRAANLSAIKKAGEGIGLVVAIRDMPLDQAVTLMIYHNFSQLPIMSGEKSVEGIVSWKSIGQALALGKKCNIVSDCKDDAIVLDYDEPLFKAFKIIHEKEVVLVKQKDGTISGIVTATDLGEQFISMAEPFLIVEQIENHIRRLFDQKFSPEDLASLSSRNGTVQGINSLSELSFGAYVRIAENPKLFAKLGLSIDRGIFAKRLEEVRKVRNEVMHFNPDGIRGEDLEKLRQTLHFLHTINTTLKAKH